MDTKGKFVVTDENEIVKIFDNEEDAKEYAYELARENAIKDIQENPVDLEEPEEEKINEWIVFRGTVETHPMTDEDRQELEECDD